MTRWLPIAVCMALWSCGGDKPEAKVPSTEIESASDAPDEHGEALTTAERSGGVVLQYLPAKCVAGRVYIDAAALLVDQSSQTVLRQLTDAILDEEREDEDARKVIDAVKRSGFDLATGVKEAAMCVGARDGDHVLAARLSIDDPIAVLNDIARSLGEPELPIEERGGAKLFVHDDFAFIQPAPGVIVLGDLERASQAMEREGADGFGPAAGLVGYLDMSVDGGRMRLELDQVGSNLSLRGSMRLGGEVAQAIERHPHEFTVEMKKKLLEEAAPLADGPFRIVYKRMQDVKVQAQGDTVTASMSFPRSDVTVLLKGAAPMLGVHLDGGGRIAGGSEVDTVDEILDIIRKK